MKHYRIQYLYRGTLVSDDYIATSKANALKQYAKDFPKWTTYRNIEIIRVR